MQHFSRRTGKPKRAYFTEEDAIEAQKRMKTVRGVETEVYLCRKCGQYHLGRLERMKGKKPDFMDFKVKNVYMGAGTVIKRNGAPWTLKYKGTIEMGERIQKRIKQGFEFEARVLYPERGAPMIVDFMELSKNDEMTLEEQRKWAEIEEGDY